MQPRWPTILNGECNTHEKLCCLNPRPCSFHAMGRQLSTQVRAPSGSSVRPGGVFMCFQHSTSKWKSQGLEQLSIDGFLCKEPKAVVMKQSQICCRATKDGCDPTPELCTGSLSSPTLLKWVLQCCQHLKASHKAKDIWRAFSWQVKATQKQKL